MALNAFASLLLHYSAALGSSSAGLGLENKKRRLPVVDLSNSGVIGHDMSSQFMKSGAAPGADWWKSAFATARARALA
jgi:hypothetical protein